MTRRLYAVAPRKFGGKIRLFFANGQELKNVVAISQAKPLSQTTTLVIELYDYELRLRTAPPRKPARKQ